MRKNWLAKSLATLVLVSLIVLVGWLHTQERHPTFHWPAGKRLAVSLSFDDARASQLDVGVPLFDKYGAKVTFFVNPSNMAKRLDGWKRVAGEGYEIGNHSRSHPCSGNFTWSRKNGIEDYTLTKMAAELDDANSETERMLGVKPKTFAYPCGQRSIGRGEETKSYVPLVAKRFLAARGFRDEAANAPHFCDLSQLLGVNSDGMSFKEMKAAILKAEQEGDWLIFGGHEIGGPAPQTTQTATLEQLLEYAKDPANGIWLDTVESIAKYIQAQRAGG